MEKFRITRKEQFCNRLLKIFLSILFLFSQNVFSITPKEIQNIVIKPEENIFFTNQELKYVLEIPEVEPFDVQTQLQNFKDGINFVSSRRMEYFANDEIAGTRIEFWFTFRDTGLAVLPPLITKVKGRTYYLPFEKVQIYENPKTIAPRLIVVVNGKDTIIASTDSKQKPDTIKAVVAKPVDFTVYLQYGIQVKQFGYELPKDSLFQEVNRFEIVQGKARSNEFSQERIPVATFKWTPLKEGSFSLPNVRLVATAYSGRNLELGLPECIVKVEKNNVNEESVKENDFSVFSYALTAPVSENIEDNSKTATLEDYEKIAELRSLEKHSYNPFNKTKQNRIQLEQSIGIAASLNENSIPLCHGIFICCLIFSICSVLFYIFKRKKSALACFLIAVVFAFFTVISGVMVFEKHGVVKGGTISPVPEDSALSSTAVTAGTCVKIKEETSSWYYIEYNENGGWIKKENLILVQ